MSTTDALHRELTARLRGAPPALPLWGERVRWGGRLHHVAASGAGEVVLCPHDACPPFLLHTHLHLGPLGLAFLRWDTDAGEFRQGLPRAAAA